MPSERLPPGPVLPRALQTAVWIARPLDFLEFCARRYGDTFTLRWTGVGDVVVISTPQAIKQVFTGDPHVLHAGEGNAILGPMVGRNSLLLLDREAHLRQRKLLLPPFHGERMQAYTAVMEQVTRARLGAWPLHSPFAIQASMRDITLEVIVRTVFGIDEAGAMRRMSELLGELLDRAAHPLWLIPTFLGIDLYRVAPGTKVARGKRAVDAALYAEIARRRQALKDGAAPASDVLTMMLEARDEDGQPMSDVEVRDELMTLLLAGHETSATALAWAFERILGHPEVLERVLGELEQPGFAELEYLDAAIKEVLRLRPILHFVMRRTKAPFEVAGYQLPAGVRVAPCIYLVQRRPELYPEPLAFRPERFLGRKIDPYAWLPFGGGPRRCLGIAFALHEMRVVLATVLRSMRLRLCEPRPVTIARRGITLAPKGGTRVVALERRTPASAVSAAAALAPTG
jgi:cytochrome P450